jgi:hypothetical protein
MTEKIYIHIIDGTDAWIPVDAERLNDNEFLIKDFTDFDPDDTSVIPQFIPGDIVTRKIKDTERGNYWTAESIVRPSDNEFKNYFEFLYRTITGDKLKDENERLKFKDILTRTTNEIKDGKFHYPAIVNYLKGIKTV